MIYFVIYYNVLNFNKKSTVKLIAQYTKKIAKRFSMNKNG